MQLPLKKKLSAFFAPLCSSLCGFLIKCFKGINTKKQKQKHNTLKEQKELVYNK